jgi:hypothetical protein
MNSKLLVLFGAVLTIVGLFLPIAGATDPMTGETTNLTFLLPMGQLGDGIVTLVLAIVAALLAIFNQTKHAVWPSLIGLCYLVWRFMEIKGAADLSGVEVNYLGWGVLFAGTVITLLAGLTAWKKAPVA